MLKLNKLPLNQGDHMPYITPSTSDTRTLHNTSSGDDQALHQMLKEGKVADAIHYYARISAQDDGGKAESYYKKAATTHVVKTWVANPELSSQYDVLIDYLDHQTEKVGQTVTLEILKMEIQFSY